MVTSGKAGVTVRTAVTTVTTATPGKGGWFGSTATGVTDGTAGGLQWATTKRMYMSAEMREVTTCATCAMPVMSEPMCATPVKRVMYVMRTA